MVMQLWGKLTHSHKENYVINFKMKTDLTLSSAKSSLGCRTQKYATFLMLILCLTLLILKTSAQSNAEKDEDEAELRKAKLRSLLARPPLNIRQKTNAQQPSKKLNFNITQPVTSVTTTKATTTTATNHQRTTSSEPPTVSKGNSVGNENPLVAFLESLRAASKLNETRSVVEAKDTSLTVDGCNFEPESGTLECKNGLEFFDLNLAFVQTINQIGGGNNNHDADGNHRDDVGKTMQLKRIDIYSCKLPIVFKFYSNETNAKESEPPFPLLQSVQSVSILSSQVETIEDGAFDEFAESLIQLDLSSNRLEQIPPAVFQLKHLIDLDLSGNRISQLPAMMADSPSLTQHGMKMESFHNLVSLSSLNLGNNR